MNTEYAALTERYQRGENLVRTRRRIADTETPVSALLKLRARLAGPCFLLESVEGGAAIGRHSIIGLAPDLIWRSFGQNAEINRRAGQSSATFEALPGDSLSELRQLVAACRIDLPEGLPAVVPTLVGYLAYETLGLVETLPPPKQDSLGVPDMVFVRPTALLVFDRLKDELTLLAPIYPADHISAQAAIEAAETRLDLLETALESVIPPPARTIASEEAPQPCLMPDTYRQLVRRAQDYIAAGDIFQVVLSQRFTLPFALPALDLYRALRRINPSPFLYFLDLEDFALVGSSPEILVRVRGGIVTIRPIAGTRPRGRDLREDQANQASLLADPKELAEHLMLLDLGRNDVGRVAVPGSVRVTARNQIELYSHVMHIVSNVEGELAAGHDMIDALLAGFPAGTVSGAPKLRAMEIIHELESEKRGIYGGGVGYFGADGAMDSCIVLRTAILKDGVMHVQAGAGVVADSDPDYEQRECEAKARALITAAQEAVRVASESTRGQ